LLLCIVLVLQPLLLLCLESIPLLQLSCSLFFSLPYDALLTFTLPFLFYLALALITFSLAIDEQRRPVLSWRHVALL
jgi:hypothetical protein